MGADISKPEFYRFESLSLNEVLVDEEFQSLIAPLAQTLCPRAKQTLGYLILDNYSTSSTPPSELPVTEPSSDAQSPSPDDSSALSTPQSESPVTEPSSDADSPSPDKALSPDANLRCLLNIKEEQLCIPNSIKADYSEWTKDSTRLFQVTRTEEKPDADIGHLLGARYNATVLLAKNVIIDRIRWRFLMLFYHQLYQLLPNYAVLTRLICNTTGASEKNVRENITNWVAAGGKFNNLKVPLGGHGFLLLLPASISNDVWGRLPNDGPKLKAAVSILTTLKIKDKVESAKANELSVRICDGLLQPFKEAASIYSAQLIQNMGSLTLKRPLHPEAHLRPHLRPCKMVCSITYSATPTSAQGAGPAAQRIMFSDQSQPRSYVPTLESGFIPGMSGQLLHQVERQDQLPIQGNVLNVPGIPQPIEPRACLDPTGLQLNNLSEGVFYQGTNTNQNHLSNRWGIYNGGGLNALAAVAGHQAESMQTCHGTSSLQLVGQHPQAFKPVGESLTIPPGQEHLPRGDSPPTFNIRDNLAQRYPNINSTACSNGNPGGSSSVDGNTPPAIGNSEQMSYNEAQWMYGDQIDGNTLLEIGNSERMSYDEAQWVYGDQIDGNTLPAISDSEQMSCGAAQWVYNEPLSSAVAMGSAHGC